MGATLIRITKCKILELCAKKHIPKSKALKFRFL